MNIDFRTVLNAVAWLPAAATLPGTLELGFLTLGSMFPAKKRPAACAASGSRMAVVIPAHNERDSIQGCLQTLHDCEGSMELADVWVIADNCTDDTATVAHKFDADVIERFDDARRGKGHALEYAFEILMPKDYREFIVIDADSIVPEDFLRAAAAGFSGGANAFQAPYLVSNPDASRTTRLLDLALRGFNLVRIQGRERWGLSVGILGNGFGLTRQVLRRVPYTAKSVVEDLEYHLSLVEAGYRVHCLESTRIYAAMPTGEKGQTTQRARWEGGRLRVLFDQGPRLLSHVLSGRLRFIEPLSDLLLLPLAFHVALLAAATVLSTGTALWAALAGFAVAMLHVSIAMARGGSILRDLKALASIPGYLAWKLLKLPQILAASAKQAAWVRTDRAAVNQGKP